MERSDIEAARLTDLLVTRATEGLDERERTELEQLGAVDIEYESSAALVNLLTLPAEPLPPHLADKIIAAATRAPSQTAPAVPAVPASLTAPRLRTVSASPKHTPDRGMRRWLVGGWALAAAATILATWALATGSEEVTPVAPAGRDIAEKPSVRFPWIDIPGEVVWHPASQRGELRVVGLAVNDPRSERYQLWIVDGDRDARFPVDGGLFDVRGTETVYAFAPRVIVGKATVFRVTLEDARGAVVSSGSTIVARTAM